MRWFNDLIDASIKLKVDDGIGTENDQVKTRTVVYYDLISPFCVNTSVLSLIER